jgi:hypothetical protein
MQNDPVVSKASELLRLGLMPSPDELKAGKVSVNSTFQLCHMVEQSSLNDRTF